MQQRFFVTAAFNLLYILTPELLPTRIRASAMGICITSSRLGGLVAPFVAVGLVEHGRVSNNCSTFLLRCPILWQ